MISVASEVVSVTGFLEFAREKDFGLLRMIGSSSGKNGYISPSQ